MTSIQRACRISLLPLFASRHRRFLKRNDSVAFARNTTHDVFTEVLIKLLAHFSTIPPLLCTEPAVH